MAHVLEREQLGRLRVVLVVVLEELLEFVAERVQILHQRELKPRVRS